MSQDETRWQALESTLSAARMLSEPDEPNPEYVRGQVNLIQDASGLGLGGETSYDVLTAIITGQISLSAGLAKLADLVRSGEASA